MNTIVVKRKEKQCDKCKRCGDIETPIHVWKCRAPEAIDIWRKSIDKIRSHLTATNTDPQVQQDILSGLLAWYCSPTAPPSGDGLNRRQSIIGWDFMTDGWLTKEWRMRQSLYWISKQQRSSVQRWVTALILKLWEVAWDLWEHRNVVEYAHIYSVKFIDRVQSRTSRFWIL